jgi:long-subunit acyl-CoA synthetase (AMP-forming)
MLSHDNLTWVGSMVAFHFKDRRCTDRLVSYLPLSHIAAQVGREGTREGWREGGMGGGGANALTRALNGFPPRSFL